MKEINVGPVTAYGIARKHGFTGTEQEWLDSLKATGGDGGDGGMNVIIQGSEPSLDEMYSMIVDDSPIAVVIDATSAPKTLYCTQKVVSGAVYTVTFVGVVANVRYQETLVLTYSVARLPESTTNGFYWTTQNATLSVNGHTHTISNVTNLQTALDGKSDTDHTHPLLYADKVHTHDADEVLMDGLDLTLSEYAAGLGDSFASKTHSHVINDVTNLQTTLNGKSDTSHTHTAAEVGARASTWMPTASDVGARPSTWTPTASDVGAAPATHSHAISDVTNLQTTLNGKAASTHTHTISDVTNLQTSLDAASPVPLLKTGAQNFNDYTTSGKFLLAAGAHTNGPTALSGNYYGVLTVSINTYNSSLYGVQEFVAVNAVTGNNFKFFRLMRGGTWQSWYTEYSSANVTSASGVSF